MLAGPLAANLPILDKFLRLIGTGNWRGWGGAGALWPRWPPRTAISQTAALPRLKASS